MIMFVYIQLIHVHLLQLMLWRLGFIVEEGSQVAIAMQQERIFWNEISSMASPLVVLPL
jgi:hypothetical protein